ncbi:unnamed protein product [Paramecium sonneborni]|uniref:Uncharacterized protein n=1 Tax=Paramecium sonneborni TaxID=65129 RepID=A0A8S1RPB5_9CILI|nr:unnamed protein product [Paramecium sonneborni]
MNSNQYNLNFITLYQIKNAENSKRVQREKRKRYSSLLVYVGQAIEKPEDHKTKIQTREFYKNFSLRNNALTIRISAYSKTRLENHMLLCIS